MKPLFVVLLAFAVLLAACKKKDDHHAGHTVKDGEHRCANCGMATDLYPEWEQKVISEDKGTMYFDGARCMFKILLDSLTTPQKIEKILVKDYYTQEYIDGTKAFYVIGSDVLGPMGRELIPFATEEAAQQFSTEHQGEKIVLFNEVDMDLIVRLIGKMKMK